MGPNHYFNADLFGRVHFLVAALTDNIGHIAGNVGSFAGNYRGSLFQAMGQWILEDPFDIEPDLTKPARVKKLLQGRVRPLLELRRAAARGREGDASPARATCRRRPSCIWFGNSNSLLGNAKWSFDVVKNTLPKQDAIFCNEWHWTSSCEYSDIVFPADSWAEFKLPDMTASCTNPFLLAFPKTPLARVHDTRSDYEILAGVAAALGRDRGRAADDRRTGRASSTATRRRTCSASSPARTRRAAILFDDLHESSQNGVPLLMNVRTYPRHAGWEQRQEDKPWYTPTGRLEFYRPEPEWQAAGESLPVWREPVDATFYEPNAILVEREAPVDQARSRPRTTACPSRRRTPRRASTATSSARGRSCKTSKHPLTENDPAYRFVFQTPKYRWGAHSTAVDSDWIAMLFGPFGDPYRRDSRTPWTGEAYVEINPADATELGAQRRRLRLARRRSGGPARTGAGRSDDAVLRRRPRDDARPDLLRACRGESSARGSTCTRPRPGTVAGAEGRPRRPRAEPADELRVALPARKPPVRHARVPAPDADDRVDDPQGLLRAGRSARASRPTSTRRRARRRRRSSRSRRPRTAASAASG